MADKDDGRDRLRGIDPWVLKQLIARERIRRVAEARGISVYQAALYLHDHPDEWRREHGES